jgi:nicotinate-nucleotide--dimethylbenzimidazole phosphoribosyltransferase
MNFPTIPAYDHETAEKARIRQNQLTKPLGALGQLEALSIQLAGITGQVRPHFPQKAVIVMAGDHGVALEGVSAYPPEVTPQMVLNFLHGGAAINVLARQAGARVQIVDIGVAYDFEKHPKLISRKIARGTQNMLKGPAMSRAQAEQAIQVGLDVIAQEIENGLDLVATGEMGIGNSTASAAITAVLTGSSVAQVTGRGTGVDDGALKHKIEVIEQALLINEVDPSDPLGVLAKVGGFEIAGLTGVVLGAASRRIPVVVDGFISGAAALVAAALDPAVKPYLIASHQSVEVGHKVIWDQLGLKPLLNLGMRLGEGSGAVLAFHLVEAAARILDEMTTFGEAGVSDKE